MDMYFNTISRFRNDDTKYQGNNNAGTLQMDPSSIGINNHDFSDIVLRDSKINEDDNGLLMFCTDIINEKFSDGRWDNIYLKISQMN